MVTDPVIIELILHGPKVTFMREEAKAIPPPLTEEGVSLPNN
jgi:hypothetical protein